MKKILFMIFLCINNANLHTSFSESDLDNEIVLLDKEEEQQEDCCYQCLFFLAEMYEKLIDSKDIDKKFI